MTIWEMLPLGEQICLGVTFSIVAIAMVLFVCEPLISEFFAMRRRRKAMRDNYLAEVTFFTQTRHEMESTQMEPKHVNASDKPML